MLDLEDDLIDNLDFQVINLGSKTLLAFHGWYDYSYSDETLDKILKRKKQLGSTDDLNDWGLIRYSSN